MSSFLPTPDQLLHHHQQQQQQQSLSPLPNQHQHLDENPANLLTNSTPAHHATEIAPSPMASFSYIEEALSKLLKLIWWMITAIVNFLGFDENRPYGDSPILLDRLYFYCHWTVKFCLTLVSYFWTYTSLTGEIVGALVYLLDHRWYPLAVTTSIGLLLVSLGFLMCYQWMWQWQEACCKCSGSNGSSSRGAGYVAAAIGEDVAPRSSRFTVAVNDDSDDDLPFIEWAKKVVGKWMLGFFIWYLYCMCMTKLTYVLWMKYSVASHHHHILELRFVNALMAFPFLGAAAVFHWCYFPASGTIMMPQTGATDAATEESPAAAGMQSLL